MRAIFIDVYAEMVSEVEHTGDYRDIYRLISHPSLHLVDCFEVIYISNKDVLFVDDTGLIKANSRPDEIRFFKWRGYHQPLAGNGLILSYDREGESVGAKFPLEYVVERVTFPNIKMIGWHQPTNDPRSGIIYGPVPIFEPRVEIKGGWA